MGLLDGLFGAKASNPAVVSAVEKYNADRSDENLLDLWDKFLKGKLLLATTIEGAKSYRKIKTVREAISITFTTSTNDKGDIFLSAYTDNEAFEQTIGDQPAVLCTGEEILELAKVKGLIGISLNPRRSVTGDLKCWQHALYIEKLADATKLNAMATKFARSGNWADAEGVLKGAIAAAQKDPGPNHPFTGELNIDLAKAMHAQGKLIEAEWVYKRALSIYESSGSHELEVATTAEALGTLCVDINKAESAIPHLTRALNIYESVPGAKPDAIGKILSFLAEISLKDKNYDEAESYYKRACISLEEKKHPDVAIVLNKLGDLYQKMERPKDALNTYLRTVAVCESMKRCREFDLATALHRSGALYFEEGNMAECEKCLLRANESYRKEGYEQYIGEVQQLLCSIKEKEQKDREEREREAEEARRDAEDRGAKRPVLGDLPTANKTESAAAGKSRFGAPGKKPADLPLLDFQSLKSGPKATYVAGGKPDASTAEPKEPLNEEEAALAQMRSFLNAVDKDGIAAASAAREHEPETIQHSAEDEPISTMEDPFSGLISDEPAPPQPVNIATQPESTIALPEPEAAAAIAIPEPEATTAIAEPEATTAIPEPEATTAIAEPEAATAIAEPEAAAPAPEPEPVISAVEPAAETEPVAQSTPESSQHEDDMGVDELFSAPMKSKSTPTVEAVTSQEPAAVVREDQKPAQATNLFGKPMDSEVSQVFNKSVLGDLTKDDRYDKPIAERIQEAAKQAAAQAATAQENDSDVSVDNLFKKPVDNEISQVFNKSMVNDLAKSNRFDKPISQRTSDPESDTEQHHEPATSTKVDAAATAPLEAMLPPPPPPPPQPAVVEKPKFDPNMTMSGLFLGELDASLADAFNAIMAEPKASNSQFDRPIAERLAEQQKAPDTVPPQAVAAPAKQEAKPEPAPEVVVETPTEPKAFDRSRFDKPINAGGLNDSPSPLFQDGELDNSLNDAFASLMANEGKQAGAAESKLPAAAAAAAQTPAPEPAPPKPKPPVDLSKAKTPQELIALIDERLPDEPNNADLWLRKGTALVQLQRLDEAIKVFDKVTSMTPSDPKAWYCKGSSLHLKQKFEDALYCFNHVLNLEKDNIKAMLRKAECLMKLGRADQSIILYDRILLLQPNFTAGWLSKARALLQQRKLQESLECYRHVLSLDPKNEEATKANNLISSKLGVAVQ